MDVKLDFVRISVTRYTASQARSLPWTKRRLFSPIDIVQKKGIRWFIKGLSDILTQQKEARNRRHEVRESRFDAGLYKLYKENLLCYIVMKQYQQHRRFRMELSYTNVECFIKPIFSHLHVYQLRNLILVVYGIIHSRSLECAEIARHVPTRTDHHHTKKRIHRFLDNENVDLSLLMKCWCKFMVVILLYGLRTYLPVIVDITWVCGEKYLVASIPFLFRCIPIAFRRFTDEEIGKGTSQNLIENAFFEWLHDTLIDYRVVIIADRGFRRASLIEHLRGLGLHYVIRVCGNVWISTSKDAKEKYCGILGSIKLQAGERRHIYNALYHQTYRVPTHLVLGMLKAEKGKKVEPWYIATDLSNLDKAYAYYERRMWIEEMFRDFKSRFHWCKYKVETERRREMLTFCLMVSYTIVALLGYQVLKTNRQSRISSYGKSSIIWLGIGILNHKRDSASALFRQIRRRYGLIAEVKAA